MSFLVFVDGSANLTRELREGIEVLPCDYLVNGKAMKYDGNLEEFDSHGYYEGLKSGNKVETSLLNTQLFLDHFTSLVKTGKDIIYVAMSSGISGTYNAAKLAAEELMETIKGSFVHIVDSKGCGFGSGLLAVKAAMLSKEGMACKEAAKVVDDLVQNACQYFTVDDLNFLKNTGRVSGATAMIGSILNVKPILFGDKTGHIIACNKVRGRKKSISELFANYKRKKMDIMDSLVCISHGDCISDARELERMIKEESPDARVVVADHEPFSGAHVGPGMLGLFFWGKER